MQTESSHRLPQWFGLVLGGGTCPALIATSPFGPWADGLSRRESKWRDKLASTSIIPSPAPQGEVGTSDAGH